MLITLGDLAVDTYRRTKPLLLLAYLALEGQTARHDLRLLLWPNAKQPDASLRVVLHQLKQAGLVTLVDDESPVCVVACDAARLPRLRGAQALSAYTGAFLQGSSLPDVSAEFGEWVETQRLRLAKHVVEEALNLAESSPPETAAQLAERAYRVPGAPPPTPEVLQRMVRLTLPGSPLETELQTELLGLVGAAEASALPGRAPQRMLGRSAELDTLLAWAAEPHAWAALVSGPGGIGKSSLLRELLRELALSNSWATLIDAEGAATAGELLPRLATACAPGQPVEGTWAGLAPLLGPRPILLLDGVDDLDDLPDLLTTLRAELPGARWVLTGRRRLGRLDLDLLGAGQAAPPGELLVLPLGGLDLPSAAAGLPEIAASSAVAVFLQGARRVRRDFRLDSSNAARIAGLARRLLGHPLALTLAASWLRVEGLDEVYARVLKQAMNLSSPGGDGDGHRGLMLTAQRSWELLNPAEQEAALRLSVGPDFDPDDAGALGVTGEQLDALLTHSFLETHQPGSERLRLSPALSGLLGAQALRQPERMARARARHARHYLDWFAAQAPEAPAVDAERENLRQAFGHAALTGTLEAAAVDRWLAHYDRRGLYGSGTDVFATLSDEAERVSAPDAVQAACQVACMWLALRAGRLLDAQILASRFLQGPLAADAASRMKVLNTLAGVRSMQGQWRAAGELFREAVVLARQTGDRQREAFYRSNLLANLLFWEDQAGAREELRSLEALVPDLPEFQGWQVRQRLLTVRVQISSPEAAGLLEEATTLLAQGERSRDLTMTVVGLTEQSRLHLRRGRLREAEAAMARLREIVQQGAPREAETDLAILDAELLYARGRASQARRRALPALQLSAPLGNPWNLVEILLVAVPDLQMRDPQRLQAHLAAVAVADQLMTSQRRRARAASGLEGQGTEGAGTPALDLQALQEWLTRTLQKP